MSVPDSILSLPDALADQPIERVTRDGVEYVVLGTAHVSRTSMEAVRELVRREPFDAIAVELCESRAHSIRDPDAFKQMDLFQVFRQGKAGMVAASLVLATYQKRLADQYGIEPGAEMKAAMTLADADGRPLWLIDREVGTTLRRAWSAVGFWQRFGLFGGLLASVFERGQIAEEEIEKLKQGDLMESAFSEFASQSAPLFHSLISERDSYMAARLREEAQSVSARPCRVLVVIGAGHLKGLVAALQAQREPPTAITAELARTPPRPRWPKWLALGLVLLVFAAIAWAFHRNTALGMAALRDWVLFTGGFSALGALIAAAHPLSILAAFVAGPIKPFRPGIPSGGISAMVEVWRRRPRVLDFEALRDDISHWTGWWKNRVARALLNFFLVCLGTVVGEYTAGIHILRSLF